MWAFLSLVYGERERVKKKLCFCMLCEFCMRVAATVYGRRSALINKKSKSNGDVEVYICRMFCIWIILCTCKKERERKSICLTNSPRWQFFIFLATTTTMTSPLPSQLHKLMLSLSLYERAFKKLNSLTRWNIHLDSQRMDKNERSFA